MGRADRKVTDGSPGASDGYSAVPGPVRSARLKRTILRRLRVLQAVAVSACVLAAALVCGLFFPTQPCPVLTAAAELRAKDALDAIESEVLAAAADGRELTLTVTEDCLAVLISRLIEEAGGHAEVWVRCRAEAVRVWMRLQTAARVPAVIELRMQPSLLQGLLFCGLRGIRVGLWPFPLFLGPAVRNPGESGWMQARNAYGYAFPGSFVLRGERFEFVDIWPADGAVEVTLRAFAQGGD